MVLLLYGLLVGVDALDEEEEDRKPPLRSSLTILTTNHSKEWGRGRGRNCKGITLAT